MPPEEQTTVTTSGERETSEVDKALEKANPSLIQDRPLTRDEQVLLTQLTTRFESKTTGMNEEEKKKYFEALEDTNPNIDLDRRFNLADRTYKEWKDSQVPDEEVEVDEVDEDIEEEVEETTSDAPPAKKAPTKKSKNTKKSGDDPDPTPLASQEGFLEQRKAVYYGSQKLASLVSKK